MHKDTLKLILNEFQEARFPRIVPRELKVPLDTDKAIAITGVRRCGKTFWLFGLAQQLVQSGVPKRHIGYVSFDDPRLVPADALDLELLREAHFELAPKADDGHRYLLLDEVQRVRNWELGVRRLLDTREFRLFVTGSSSQMLSRDIATTLRGRGLSYELLPFSPREFLAARGIPLDHLTSFSRRRFEVIAALEDYFNFGGFPEVVLEKEPNMRLRILREYLDTMFLRDIVERYRIRNLNAMRTLFRFLMTNIATPFSVNAFSRWLKGTVPVIKRTVINYLNRLEETGLVFLVRKFSHSLKETALRPRKVYVVDPGLRAVHGLTFSQDRGRVLENLVLLELRRQEAVFPLLGIYYWQNGKGQEVDFVITDAGKPKALIQVCADPQAFGVWERELAPLGLAMEKFSLRKSTVITADYEGEEKLPSGLVQFVPFWKWALTFDWERRV
ncbi:MAG: ATP-binding protein [candidate division WOR-3 bacterium]